MAKVKSSLLTFVTEPSDLYCFVLTKSSRTYLERLDQSECEDFIFSVGAFVGFANSFRIVNDSSIYFVDRSMRLTLHSFFLSSRKTNKHVVLLVARDRSSR